MDDSLETIAKHAPSLQNTADELINRYNDLGKFEEAAIWDSDAQAVINLFERYRESLCQFVTRQEQKLKDLISERNALPFVKKIFASQADEKRIKEDISSSNHGIESIDTAIDTLYALIDRTPSSKAEQSQMLQELRQEKTELTLEKRSINQNMQAIRTKARQETAKLSGVSKGTMGEIARYSRASLRRQKEAALLPQEDAKAAIERQLIEIEKRINWIARFSGDDPQPQYSEYVKRCAYCGRRVEEYSVCPGCGSDVTIQN